MTGDPLFPDVQPRCARRIAVGDGHYLYVEEIGPADGLPVLFLHGGPGSGCTPGQRRLFDPQRFRTILVDQRGAGRSLPLGDLHDNTTADLIADLDLLREALGIPAWIVFGGSWGSLLALAYAQIYPENILGLVLRGIFLGSRREIAAYVQGNGEAPSPAWQAYAATLPAGEQSDLHAATARRTPRRRVARAHDHDALALLAGQRGTRAARQTVFALPVAWWVSGIIGAHWPALATLSSLTTLSFALAGVLVALNAKVWDAGVVAFAIAAGVLHGLTNGATLTVADSGGLALGGVVSGIFFLTTILSAEVVALPTGWPQIVVRVTGSWIAATGLLMLGWLARPMP